MTNTSPSDPSSFLKTIFEKESSNREFPDPLTALLSDEFYAICRDFDLTQIQESWSWRNVHFAREIAKFLIDEKGEIDRRTLFQTIGILEETLFSLGPERHHDGVRQQHVLKILKRFYNEKEYVYALKRIRSPDGHRAAEKLIRETLFLPEGKRITDAHARRAAFSALLTYLRQNVGSCFATAPAILIQQSQSLQFLADISQLLGTGRLTRVYEGMEYTVPLSVSWGVGDLLRPFFLTSLGQNPLETLAFSPGLQEAFFAAGLLDQKGSKEQRREECERLLRESGIEEDAEDSFFFLTAEKIIKTTLLHAHSLSEKDLQDFHEKTFQGPVAELLIQVPAAMGEKSLACDRYLKSYEMAKGAFKALTDNALLKAWEFTLASLSEAKANFARWNLYSSLGVQPQERYGIGESLYQVIQERITKLNEEIEEFQSKYDHLFAQAKYLEGRMRRADTDTAAGWIRAEYEIRKHEINRALNERDEAYEKGRKLSNLYPLLIDFYGKKIPEFFQEVYDAEMHDVSANTYDDSPAGFRLLYKHGRINTSLWTMIYSAGEYIQYLTSFFVATEVELNQLQQLEGLQKEISGLITTAISTIKRPEFLESSFFRLAKAYHERVTKNPLENLDKVQRKPWVYVSGGTMATLVSSYWGNSEKPTEEKRWVESENEFLAFLIDTIKELPLSIQQIYQKNPDYSMLAFSPTHAFLCKPGWKRFRQGWESDIYTYTWIRDQWVFPQQRFLDSILLDTRMMETLIQELLQFIPVSYRPIAKHALKDFNFIMTPPEFREKVIKILSYEKWLRRKERINLVAEELDSILYRSLPLFPEHSLRDKLHLLFSEIDEVDDTLQREIFHHIERTEEAVGKYKILKASDLRNIAKGLLILALKETRSPIFFHQKITEAMQKTGLAFPEPILFGDTNWVKNVFGFVVNPGTGNLEFWRFDECGSEGRPLSIWKRFLNGTTREEWGLYTNPHQYGIFL